MTWKKTYLIDVWLPVLYLWVIIREKGCVNVGSVQVWREGMIMKEMTYLLGIGFEERWPCIIINLNWYGCIRNFLCISSSDMEILLQKVRAPSTHLTRKPDNCRKAISPEEWFGLIKLSQYVLVGTLIPLSYLHIFAFRPHWKPCLQMTPLIFTANMDNILQLLLSRNTNNNIFRQR